MTLSLRLNPALPVVWQNPLTVQIGIDPPHVVLADVDDRFLPLLHHLRAGMTRPGLVMVAKSEAVGLDELDRFLQDLSPALRPVSPTPLPSLWLHYSGKPAEAMAGIWRQLGYRCVREEDDAGPTSEVILVSDFVIDPQWHHTWLRRDIPHTPVTFLDQSVVIGPRVIPGVTACLHCVRLRRLAENPSTPALDSQLWGMRSPLRTEPMETRAAFLLAELLSQGTPGERWRVEADSGKVSTRVFEREPGCDCQGL